MSTSDFDIARVMALDPDWRNAAHSRSDAYRLNSATLASVSGAQPARIHHGIARSPSRTSLGVTNCHRETIEALAEPVGAAGLDRPSQLCPHHFMHRVAADRLAEIYQFLEPGELLSGNGDACFAQAWTTAAGPSKNSTSWPSSIHRSVMVQLGHGAARCMREI